MRVWRSVAAVLLWGLQILMGAGFIAIGIGKFQDPSWVQRFARWGYPDGFYMVVGVLECAGAIILLVPRLASYGAALIGAIMIGAAATHAVHGEMARLPPTLFFLVMMTVIGVGRWSRAARPSSRRVQAAHPV
jgi:uncharacterized membrane protein YphA (DoxX/SURF4 family)